MKLRLLSAGFALSLSLSASAQPSAEPQRVEEIVVVGRQPGPPLWRVRNGERVLWIFPHLSPLPKDIVWETDKTANVIAQAEEIIGLPRVEARPPTAVALNPINLVRGIRLVSRTTKNPDGLILRDVLPAEAYRRFLALRSRYFPREDLEELRPVAAGALMTRLVEDEAGLTRDGKVMKTLERLIRRNRDAARTDIEIEVEIEGNFREIAGRLETFAGSLEGERELACFDALLSSMENDLDTMKRLANAWAQGDGDDLRATPLPSVEPCEDLLRESSERELMRDVEERSDRLWLEAAERALMNRKATFAILEVEDLVRGDGLLEMLRARGYEVLEP